MGYKRNDLLNFVATPKEILDMIERECATVSDRRHRLRDWMNRIDKLRKQYDEMLEERKIRPKLGTFDTTNEDLEVASNVLGVFYSELQEEYDKYIFRPRGDHFQIFFNDHDYGLIDKKKGFFDIHCLLQRPNQKIAVTFLYGRKNLDPVSEEELITYEMNKEQYETYMSKQFKGDRVSLEQIKEKRDRLKNEIEQGVHDPRYIPDMISDLEELETYISDLETPKGKQIKFKDQNKETARTGIRNRIQDVFRILEEHEREYKERNGANPGLSVYLQKTIIFGYTLTYNPSESELVPVNWLT